MTKFALFALSIFLIFGWLATAFNEHERRPEVIAEKARQETMRLQRRAEQDAHDARADRAIAGILAAWQAKVDSPDYAR